MSLSATRGTRGESIARLFLEDCGLTCLASRYRLPAGEIDLVMVDDETLVFVEVKVSGPNNPADPVARVRPAQLARLRGMARRYLQRERPGVHRWVRFDVVGIRLLGPGRGLVLDHREGVG